MGSNASDPAPDKEPHPSGGNSAPTVPTDPEYQLPMFDPDGAALIDIARPEDDDAALALTVPVGGVTTGPATDVLPDPVLRRVETDRPPLTKDEVDDRIREVAALPSIGGYRRISAVLRADHGIDVSHMKVKRVLEKTPVEVA